MVNILIIEDEPMVVSNIKEFLNLYFKDSISTVMDAESGRKAELILKGTMPFHIILWDYELQDGVSGYLIDSFKPYSDVILMSIHERAMIDSIRNKWNLKVNSLDPLETKDKKELVTEPKNKLLKKDSLFYHMVNTKIQRFSNSPIKLFAFNQQLYDVNAEDIIMITNAKSKYVYMFKAGLKVSQTSDVVDNSKVVFLSTNNFFISENKYKTVRHFLELELNEYEIEFLDVDDAVINKKFIVNAEFDTSRDIVLSITSAIKNDTVTQIKKSDGVYLFKPKVIGNYKLTIRTDNRCYSSIEEFAKQKGYV